MDKSIYTDLFPSLLILLVYVDSRNTNLFSLHSFIYIFPTWFGWMDGNVCFSVKEWMGWMNGCWWLVLLCVLFGLHEWNCVPLKRPPTCSSVDLVICYYYYYYEIQILETKFHRRHKQTHTQGCGVQRGGWLTGWLWASFIHQAGWLVEERRGGGI